MLLRRHCRRTQCPRVHINEGPGHQQYRAAQGGLQVGRARQRGVSWQDRYGFVIGGNVKNGGAVVNEGSCNALYPPVRLLDLTSFERQNVCDPGNLTKYRVPKSIASVIGSGLVSIGLAIHACIVLIFFLSSTKTSPSEGWDDPELAAILSKRMPRYESPSNHFASSSSDLVGRPSSQAVPGQPSTSEGSSSRPKSSSAPLIIGVVSQIAVLVLASGVFFWVRRRKKQQRQRKQKDASLPPEMSCQDKLQPPQHPGELPGLTPEYELSASERLSKDRKSQTEPRAIYELQ